LDTFAWAFSQDPLTEREIPDFYCSDTIAVRTADKYNSPIDRILMACKRDLPRNATLFLGHVGCGKSTELNRLKQRLESDGYPAVSINCMNDADIFQIDAVDIMVLITEGLSRVIEQNNIAVSRDSVSSILKYLRTDVETVSERIRAIGEEAEAEAGLSTPELLKQLFRFAGSIKVDLKNNNETRKTLTEKMETRASEWLRRIDDLSDQIIGQLNGKKPTLIFENLEKAPTAVHVLNLLGNSTLSQMRFPIIYTFSISQYYTPEFADLESFYNYEILPMIQVNHIDGIPDRDGRKAMEKLVKLRADEELFDKEALALLIAKTGGALRDLFRCINFASDRAVCRGAGKIQVQDAKSALTQLQTKLRSRFTEEDIPGLVRILNGSKSNIADKDFMLRMMHASVILEYNGYRWHDLHPLVADYLKGQGYGAQ